MGFFDIFKKKQNIENKENFKSSLPYTMSRDFEGKPLIEYREKMPNNDINITRLTIDTIKGDLANCYIFWYKDGNAIMIDPTTGREIGTENILTKIDFNLLQSDPNYVHALMCNLLNRDRVMKYLQRGLQENPENPCGKYVGSIEKSENTYKKVFDSNIGRISHNSPEMVAERKTNRENKIRNIREDLIAENYDAKKALERAQELRRKLNEYEKDNSKER